MLWSAYHCVHGTSCLCTLSAGTFIEPLIPSPTMYLCGYFCCANITHQCYLIHLLLECMLSVYSQRLSVSVCVCVAIMVGCVIIPLTTNVMLSIPTLKKLVTYR